jgi:hypothetical protein
MMTIHHPSNNSHNHEDDCRSCRRLGELRLVNCNIPIIIPKSKSNTPENAVFLSRVVSNRSSNKSSAEKCGLSVNRRKNNESTMQRRVEHIDCPFVPHKGNTPSPKSMLNLKNSSRDSFNDD